MSRAGRFARAAPPSVAAAGRPHYACHRATAFLIIAWMMMASPVRRSAMLRNRRVQMAAVLAVGALLGYLAASGRVNPLSWAGAIPPAAQPGGVKPAEPGSDKPACCEEVNKGQLLALADPKVKAA